MFVYVARGGGEHRRARIKDLRKLSAILLASRRNGRVRYRCIIVHGSRVIINVRGRCALDQQTIDIPSQFLDPSDSFRITRQYFFLEARRKPYLILYGHRTNAVALQQPFTASVSSNCVPRSLSNLIKIVQENNFKMSN
jgi:hypothetical protein